MALVAPNVVGPLSECSSWVKVQGQLSGSTVAVFADGVQVAGGAATSSDQFFQLNVPLTANASVTATQDDGSGPSDPSSEPIVVLGPPEPEAPSVAFRTPVFDCAECLWLDGLWPGAEVRVSAAVTGGLGTGQSREGTYARVGLTTPVPIGEQVAASQEACTIPGPETLAPPTESPIGEPGAAGRLLPPPVIDRPLGGCEMRVTVRDVFPGATVQLSRSGGPDRVACFDLSSLYFNVPALAPGEELTATQEFPNCDLGSGAGPPATVGPTHVPRPHIAAPLCAGATRVAITGLKFGALVNITVEEPSMDAGPGPTTVYLAEAPADGSAVFDIPPGLPENAKVTATQELCGVVSQSENEVTVEAAPAALQRPSIPEPLLECATVVRVENLQPGTTVWVYLASNTDAPIGTSHAWNTEEDVAVPALQAGQQVIAVVTGCGLPAQRSEEVEVQELDELHPPTILEPVYHCPGEVHLEDVVPGARVDVYVNGAWRGTATAGAEEVTVGIEVGSLNIGDAVRARQRLCGQVSELSDRAVVEEFLGEWEIVGGEDGSQILAIHAALLHTGKIVYFGGDQHHAIEAGHGDIDNTRLFDCSTHRVTVVTGLAEDADLFCAGHSLLEDGRLIVAGGTSLWSNDGEAFHRNEKHFKGLRSSWYFDPEANQDLDEPYWVETGQLNRQRGRDDDLTGGRWYPTLVTLADGRALAVSGHPLDNDTRHNNTDLELFDPQSNTWQLVGSGASTHISDDSDFYYPRLHVIPDANSSAGMVFCANPGLIPSATPPQLKKWRPYSDPNDWTDVSGVARRASPNNGQYNEDQRVPTVLLPLLHEDGYHPRVLISGDVVPATIDLAPSGGSASWTDVTTRAVTDDNAGQTNPRRIYSNAVLLPTGDVAMVGGVTGLARPRVGVLIGELYDPETGAWSQLPAANVVRDYHSVALLMPDGAIWTAGSNHDGRQGDEEVREHRMEIFRPWYFCRDRPVIDDAPKYACPGDEVDILTRDMQRFEGGKARVALVRSGSVTHAFNPDQRYVGVPFELGSDRLQAFLPSDGSVLIPGWYLLFVLDSDGVPSLGHFIQICARAAGSDSEEDEEDVFDRWREIWERVLEILRRWLSRWPFGRWFRDRLPGKGG